MKYEFTHKHDAVVFVIDYMTDGVNHQFYRRWGDGKWSASLGDRWYFDVAERLMHRAYIEKDPLAFLLHQLRDKQTWTCQELHLSGYWVRRNEKQGIVVKLQAGVKHFSSPQLDIDVGATAVRFVMRDGKWEPSSYTAWMSLANQLALMKSVCLFLKMDVITEPFTLIREEHERVSSSGCTVL
jgi:hypothetical protein